jgi:hypothetical protein
MKARMEKIGCIYDRKDKLIQIIHWDESSRNTRKYTLVPMSMEEEIEMFNTDERIVSGDTSKK